MDTKHLANAPQHRQFGFSLIEAATVVAVTAIVAAAAMPGMVTLLDGRRLDAAATALAADVQLVRTEAVARNSGVRISFHDAPGGGTCWVVHTGSAAQCSCGEAPPAACSGGAVESKTVVLGSADRVSVRANVASIAFDPLHGTSTPTGTLRLVDVNGRAVHHVVNVMGRVRSCTPSGVPGWRAC